MTEEQIALEYELILLDKARKDSGNEQFEDETFEDWDKDSEEFDDKLSDPSLLIQSPSEVANTTTAYNEDEWEAVE